MDSPWLFWVLLPFGGALGWWALSWLISWIGGWHALGREYRAAKLPPPEGNYWTKGSGEVGLSRYRGRLFVGATPAGLYVALRPRVFPGHPPLLIPWGAVVGYERRPWFRVESLLLAVRVRGGQKLYAIRFHGQNLIDGVEKHLATLRPPPLPGG